MVYQVEGILRDVRVALDQNRRSGALLAMGDETALSLDEVIRSKICEGVRRVHMAAPVHMLEPGHRFGQEDYRSADGSGYVPLPDDFMRLVMFRRSDWSCAVYEAITAADVEYQYQSSRFKGLRGTPQRPVCAVVQRPTGNVLEYYSSKDDTAQITAAVYVPYPKIDAQGGVEISEPCYDSVVDEVAKLTAAVFGVKR